MEVKNRIYFVLVRKGILRYVRDVETAEGMGRTLSDDHIMPCKVSFLDAWIKRREVVNTAWRVRSGKQRESQYRKVYAK